MHPHHQYSLRNLILNKCISLTQDLSLKKYREQNQQSHGIQQNISTRTNLIGYDVND